MSLVLSSTARRKEFYHHTFEVRKKGRSQYRHTLLVNPEDLQQNEPSRMTVTQTLGGAYVTDFGSGIIEVTISGITGYRARRNEEGDQTDGYQEFINFRNKVYRDFIESADPDMSMYWFNWEDEEYYQIQPKNFRLMRNKQAPLLYRYEFPFICIDKVDRHGNGSRSDRIANGETFTINLLSSQQTSLINSINIIGSILGLTRLFGG